MCTLTTPPGPVRLLGLHVGGGLVLVLDGPDGRRRLLGELLPVVLVLVLLDAVAVIGGRHLGACAMGRA
ncbi:hypothetical protein [Streptomyces sp. MBT53]|uniref:hypothetical protein n=1 Tax=Streptomyces sp. MBT53 TaxID=1488384 RepID=UPI00191355E7|nr:hypothetical protein [Streptomyces sp. MBT53]MBK6018844.1 hypothetical protein [Streptomyces sp. MBT53]